MLNDEYSTTPVASANGYESKPDLSRTGEDYRSSSDDDEYVERNGVAFAADHGLLDDAWPASDPEVVESAPDLDGCVDQASRGLLKNQCVDSILNTFGGGTRHGG